MVDKEEASGILADEAVGGRRVEMRTAEDLRLTKGLGAVPKAPEGFWLTPWKDSSENVDEARLHASAIVSVSVTACP